MGKKKNNTRKKKNKSKYNNYNREESVYNYK